VGTGVGFVVGAGVGFVVGAGVGFVVGAGVGSVVEPGVGFLQSAGLCLTGIHFHPLKMVYVIRLQNPFHRETVHVLPVFRDPEVSAAKAPCSGTSRTARTVDRRSSFLIFFFIRFSSLSLIDHYVHVMI